MTRRAGRTIGVARIAGQAIGAKAEATMSEGLRADCDVLVGADEARARAGAHAAARRGANAAPDLARRRALAAGLALVAGCAAEGTSIAPPAGGVGEPRVRVGDRWRYSVIERFRGREIGPVTARVDAVEPRIVVELFDDAGTVVGSEAYAGAWNVLFEPAYDRAQAFEVPVTLLPPGAAPGASGRVTTHYQVAGDPQPLHWSERLDVRGWESVEVPAGRFDALRIERRIGFQHREAWRANSQRLDTLWYAPAVNRWVRRTWSGTYRTGPNSGVLTEDSVEWRLLSYVTAG